MLCYQIICVKKENAQKNNSILSSRLISLTWAKSSLTWFKKIFQSMIYARRVDMVNSLNNWKLKKFQKGDCTKITLKKNSFRFTQN